MGWQQSDQMASELLNTFGEGIIVIDRQGIIRAFNRAAARLTGCSPEEALGQHCAEVCRLPICSRCAILDLFNGGPCPTGAVRTRISRDGKNRLIDVHTLVMRDEKGEPMGSMEILREVGEGLLGREGSGRSPGCPELVGRSEAMQAIYHLIELVAGCDCTVLIHGETGTGKELIAEAIHYSGARARHPLVKVNCSALPEALLETELFGHVKGAFTDAVSDRRGRFELANGGTLFLDEVGDLSPAIQLKLLRVLERKEFQRVGEARNVKVDVRIIAATHRDLCELMARGRFRQDLYYRLCVIPICVPPLRERREDIPLLVERFLAQFNGDGSKPPQSVSGPVLRALINYPWPGNIRELQNALEYASVVSRGRMICAEHLPDQLLGAPGNGDGAVLLTEGERIRQALEQNRWRIQRTAEALGMSRSTLWRRMKEHEIAKEENASA